MQTKSQVTLLLALIGWLPMLGAVNAVEPELKAVTKRAYDKIEVTRKDAKTILSVRSPSGIGSGVVSRLTGNWPECVILRLHLDGLESLKVSNGKTELVAEVTGPDNRRFLRVTKNAIAGNDPEPTKLAECEIRAFGNDGRPTKAISLKDGFFEVQLPKELFAKNPESISINWIDFYR